MAEKGERKRSLKQRIRDTQRLLAREELPETVRLTKERILKALQKELNDKQQEGKRKKITKKYRMVKFFEKRKIIRMLKSALRDLSSYADDGERAELLTEVSKLRIELNYIKHYPPSETYVALYPSTDSVNDKAVARKETILSQITEQVKNGDLPDASENLDQLKKLLSSSKDNTGMSPIEVPELPAMLHFRVLRNGKATDTSYLRRKRKRRYIAPVDEEPDSESELHLESKKKLKEDEFFL